MLRAELDRDLSCHLNQIEVCLAQLETSPHLDANPAVLEALQAQHQFLAGLQASLATANASALQMLSLTMPAIAANTTSVLASTNRQAATQTVLALMEMTDEQIAAQQQRHDREAADFHAFADQATSHIQARAAMEGIDLSDWNRQQHHWQQQYQTAKANGDRPAMFYADAMRASGLTQAAQTVGLPPEEIDKLREEELKAWQRYRLEHQMELLRQGRNAGLSGQDLETFIETRTATAHQQQHQQLQTLIEQHGLSDPSAQSEARRAELLRQSALEANEGLNETAAPPSTQADKTRFDSQLEGEMESLKTVSGLTFAPSPDTVSLQELASLSAPSPDQAGKAQSGARTP